MRKLLIAMLWTALMPGLKVWGLPYAAQEGRADHTGLPAKEVEEAVDFLYRFMPLADKTDYPRSFFEENVRTSFEARRDMPWGHTVPDLLFRHFVLPCQPCPPLRQRI